MLHRSNDPTMRYLRLHMGSDASAWGHEWLKLFAYLYERVGHCDNNFVTQLFGELADDGCGRIPRRGDNNEFATDGIRIIPCCQSKFMVWPQCN
jgi:hypothetical protein